MKENVIVKLENVSKKFDDKYVIKDFSLDIYEGEFITLLGSSGCGKTTVLRMISGLEDVTSGKVYIDSKDVTNVDATKREVNTIFQNFALFPKMTVRDNISFGLRMKKMDEEKIKKEVSSAISLVKLNGFEERFPNELSGGQQQRVAIARGIVMNPKVLLLDESLCSLDLKLRKNMQVELKKLQKKLGITFIYVTHAQDEALSMSDRIAIINDGNIVQLGSPEDIYKHPNSVFVADFIGEANIIDASITSVSKGSIKAKILDNYDIEIKTSDSYEKGEKIKVVVRPEDVLVSSRKTDNCIEGIIIDTTYSGDSTKLIIDAQDVNFKASLTDENEFKENDKVYFKFDSKSIVPLRK